MSELFSREEQLARRLDQVLPPGETSRPPRTNDPLVNLAAQVSALPTAELSEAALQRMEARMLNAFDALPRMPTHRPARRWAEMASRWAIAASLILALLTAGLIPASASSLPGNPLYLVKRTLERASLVLTTDPDAQARLQLDHALRRAEEAQALQLRGQSGDVLLAEAVQGVELARQSASASVLASPEFQLAQSRVLNLVILVAEQSDGVSQPAADATDTPSPTHTPSLTATPTDTLTATVSHTTTQTATHTPSLTATPTDTPTASHTATQTATHTSTATASHTATPSQTPSSTPTVTPSITPSPTPTPSYTMTRTLAPTRTPRPTRTTDPCPGNSCNSSGVPSGAIDPQNPPGQNGGRNDCPGGSCDAPGQSEGSNSGGNSGDNGAGNGNSNAGDNGNAGGNGNGNGGGNGGGNGNGNGNGKGKGRSI